MSRLQKRVLPTTVRAPVLATMLLASLASQPAALTSATSLLQPVSCPATRRTFTAVTEMIFEGRTDFLSIPEGNVLVSEFLNVYNGLTQSNCDAYFRRIGEITLVNMTNSAGGFMDFVSRKEQAEAWKLSQEMMDDDDMMMMDGNATGMMNMSGVESMGNMTFAMDMNMTGMGNTSLMESVSNMEDMHSMNNMNNDDDDDSTSEMTTMNMDNNGMEDNADVPSLATVTLSLRSGDDDDGMDDDGERRGLQLRPTNDDLNSTSTGPPTIKMIYTVTGTCRGCPVTRGGSFELYDDSLRRHLLAAANTGKAGLRNLRFRTRIISVEDRDLEEDDDDKIDCQCLQGTEPNVAQAPGVAECVALMNNVFEAKRIETATSVRPLYQSIDLTDLIQLDDLEEANGVGLDALDLGAGDTENDREASGRSALRFNIWGR